MISSLYSVPNPDNLFQFEPGCAPVVELRRSAIRVMGEWLTNGTHVKFARDTLDWQAGEPSQ